MRLRLKIIICNGMLIALLVFIVYLFRQEQIKRSNLQKDEREVLYIRKLLERTYIHLWELTTHAELVSVWKETDLERYRAKRREVSDTLRELKDYVHVPAQQKRIDSLCLLLQEKESLLSAVMNTFSQLQETGDIVRKKIPAIVSQMKHVTKNSETMTEISSFENIGKKKAFWSIFHRKDFKSAYREQREETIRKKNSVTVLIPSSVRLLYSLDKHVLEQQREQQQRLFMQMDNLYLNNQVLNQKLNGLVKDFEAEANRRSLEKYGQFISERESSFYTFTGLAFFICLLIFMLYVIIHRDVKRRSRYEKELEESDRKNRELLQSKKKMMLSIAHDLRSPLAVIKESAELLPGIEEKTKQDEYAENICHSSDYMLGLVNTLMEFYLLDTGQIKLHLTLFSLSVFFKETAKNYILLSEKRQLRFVTRFSGLNAIVKEDRAHLQQIINNLLSNALKFTDRGTITLNAEYHNEELLFSVQDCGSGMSAEDKERIFNAFERLENARNTPGFGLGLAITAQLVKRMNGEITVESQPGRGSTFSVFLPLSAADNNSDLEEVKPITAYQLENVRVLVIDDDQIQQKITREMFSQNGVACDCCTNSWELTSLLKKNDYDLLLTDIQMPEVDGFGILEMLRCSNIEKAKCIPVIAVTARPDDDNEYLSKGFAASIHKPFTMEQLMEISCKTIGPKESKCLEPDFSVILSGEDDEREMLRLFIEETWKDLESIHAAIEQNDLKTIHSILHKNLPLWETVSLNYPIMKVKELVIAETEQWTEKQVEEIHAIIRSVEALINFAEHKLQENK